VVEEPRFFSPDIIFIEESLCDDADGSRIEKMMANVQTQVPVIIVGKYDKLEAVRGKFPQHRIIVVPQLPPNLGDAIAHRFLPPSARKAPTFDKDAVHIGSDDPLSYGEIAFPARLTRLHPWAAQMAVPYPVENFALCRVETPMVRRVLNRDPYVKVTESYPDPRSQPSPFSHFAECYISDMDEGAARKLGQTILSYVTGQVLPGEVVSAPAPRAQAVAPVVQSVPVVAPAPAPAPVPATAPVAAATPAPAAKAVPREPPVRIAADGPTVKPVVYEDAGPEITLGDLGEEAIKTVREVATDVRSSVGRLGKNKNMHTILVVVGMFAFLAGIILIGVMIQNSDGVKEQGQEYNQIFKKVAPWKFQPPPEGGK
jgi:hypothetical protein